MTRRDRTPPGDATGPVRAAVLMGHPVQHFSPALRMLASRPDVHLRVYYWDAAADGRYDPAFGRHVRWSTDLHSGYDWWSPAEHDRPWRRGLDVVRELGRERPEVILCFGWATPTARLGIAFATLTGTPLLYYGDSSWRAPASGRTSRVRGAALRVMFRAAAGAVSTGTCNREFYLTHGMESERIHHGVYPVDAESFSAAGERQRQAPPSGTGGRPLVIGFAGKFVAIKAADDLIEAAARLPCDGPWQLWLIGDGPERPRLERLSHARGLAGRVRFLGFRNTDELAELFAAIDIMVMPSRREPRGLVAVEAMAAGAAVVVSSATGVWGTGDAVQDGQSGLVFPAGDVGALAACLRRLMDDAGLRTRLMAAGRARALSFGPGDFASTAAAALVATAAGSRHVARR